MARLVLQIIPIFLLSLTWGGFFLENGLGMNGLQLGGAFTANPNTNEAIYWNNANLINVPTQLNFSYSKSFTDVGKTALIFNTPIAKDTSIGVAYAALIVENNIQRDSQGLITGQGSYDYNNSAYFLSVSQRINGIESVGITLKKYGQTALKSIDYYLVDLGYKTRLFDLIDFGLTVRDIYAWGDSASIKPSVQTGLSIGLFSWIINLDGVYQGSFKRVYPRIGAIFNGFPALQGKVGYDGYSEQMYFGLSLNLWLLGLDYLYSEHEVLGNTHQMGVRLTL